jgi:hypothetical protein
MDFVPTYPLSYLPPKEFEFGWEGASIEGGRALSGAYTAIEFSGGGYLTVSYKGILYQTPASHRRMNMLAAHLAGSIRTILLPILSDWTGPFNVGSDGYPIIGVNTTFSDGATFGDGAYFTQSTVQAEVYADSDPEEPGTLQLLVTAGNELEGGEWFAVKHPTKNWRAYLVRRVVSIASVSTGGGESGLTGGVLYTVVLDRPLREQVFDGDRLEFRRPKCLMRLRAGEKLAPNARGRWVGSNDLNLIEAP